MMMRLAVATGLLLAFTSARLWAEDALPGDGAALPRSLGEEGDPGVMPGNAPDGVPGIVHLDSDVLPPWLAELAVAAPAREAEFSLGAAVGFLDSRGADRGTWFAGVQGRLHFLKYFAAEGAITFHEDRYESGDVHVTQYPVQVSGMIYPFPEGEFRPYALAGVGWYYTRITYTGTFTGITNQTDHTFGEHAGAGLEIRLGPSTSIDADLRYIWLNPSSRVVNRSDFDYWQVTGGINFFF